MPSLEVKFYLEKTSLLDQGNRTLFECSYHESQNQS